MMVDLSSLYKTSSIRGVREPFRGAIVTSYLVITDDRIEEVNVLKPDPESLRTTTEVRRYGNLGMDLADLGEVQIVSVERSEPRGRSWDPEALAKLEAAGLPPPYSPPDSGKRFFAVIVHCLDHKREVGYQRTIGIYEQSGFTADRHRLLADGVGEQRLPVHPEGMVRMEAEALVRWIEEGYHKVYPDRDLKTATNE